MNVKSGESGVTPFPSLSLLFEALGSKGQQGSTV